MHHYLGDHEPDSVKVNQRGHKFGNQVVKGSVERRFVTSRHNLLWAKAELIENIQCLDPSPNLVERKLKCSLSLIRPYTKFNVTG